jgi:hypothetical protein
LGQSDPRLVNGRGQSSDLTGSALTKDLTPSVAATPALCGHHLRSAEAVVDVPIKRIARDQTPASDLDGAIQLVSAGEPGAQLDLHHQPRDAPLASSLMCRHNRPHSMGGL